MIKMRVEIKSRLRGELRTLYPSASSALVIVGDVGLPTQNLNVNSNPNVLWASILDEAEKQNKVVEIIEMVLGEYPKRTVLQEVLLEINDKTLVYIDLKDQWSKILRLIESNELSFSIEKAEQFIQVFQEYIQNELSTIKNDFDLLNNQDVTLNVFKEEKLKLLERLKETLFEKLNRGYFSGKRGQSKKIGVKHKNQAQVDMEKIVGESPYNNDLVSMAWLSKGVEASKSVVLVITENGGRGTGFILEGGFLLTANYIVPGKEQARRTTINLVINDFTALVDGSKEYKYKLDETVFYSSPFNKMDYSLIKIIDNPKFPVAENGYLELETVNKVLPGDIICIVHFPGGANKQISYSNNSVVECLGDNIIYKAKTFGGSGGAPVLNQDWKVVAMHQRKLNNNSENMKSGKAIKAILADLRNQIPSDEIDSFPFLKTSKK
ncbi:MAG: trypsin-like peptidase domain-containing protein [Saprospiraceae bacterium]|nr:trypsin-like peptidase domain-containing protein [Saprospiraceae bacterium]